MDNYVGMIERQVFRDIEAMGGLRVTSTARVTKKNAHDRGVTEFFYTTPQIIYEAFHRAHEAFGGTAHTYRLTNAPSTYKARLKRLPQYRGEHILPFDTTPT